MCEYYCKDCGGWVKGMLCMHIGSMKSKGDKMCMEGPQRDRNDFDDEIGRASCRERVYDYV